MARYEPAGDVVHISFNGHGSPQRTQGFNLTDLGNAERFVARHGEDVRYCYQWRRWLVWTGARWEHDEAGRVHRLAKATVRSIYREASDEDEDRRKALAKHARASESETRIRLWSSSPSQRSRPLPTSSTLTPGSQHQQRHDRPADRGAAGAQARGPHNQAGPGRSTPRVGVGSAGVGSVPRASAAERGAARVRAARHVQRATPQSNVCSSTTGQERTASTFQETVAAALGNRHENADGDAASEALRRRAERVARLKGARFVTASETEEGRRLAESLVKDLTGQDTISARFMWAEWFDFKPTHALHLSTNHKPEIRGTDNAIWRRIRLVPWAVTIPPAEQDKKLPQKLREELPGVLAWIVRGCSEWLREGLLAPEEVRQATRAYRAEMDVSPPSSRIAVRGENETAFAGELWGSWKRWCEETGEQFGTQKRFGGRARGARIPEPSGQQNGAQSVGRAVTTAFLGVKGRYTSLNHSNVRFAGNSERTEPSEPKNNKVLKVLPHEETPCEKGSDGSDGSEMRQQTCSAPVTDLRPGESATVEQLERIRELVRTGMSEKRAREEILGKGWVEL